MASARKLAANAPFFDSDFVVVPIKNMRTTRGGKANAQSPAFLNGVPTPVSEPTCAFCGRTGDAIASEPYLYAIPASIWQPTDRSKHGAKFAEADKQVFLSDLGTPEGRARVTKLAVEMWCCKQEVIDSLVKVQAKDGGEPDRMLVDHTALGVCPCGEVDAEGYDLGDEDDPEVDGAGGRLILSKHGFFVFNDIDENASSNSTMHYECATRQCNGCGNLLATNEPDPEEVGWMQYEELKNDLGKLVLLCSECMPASDQCHAARDMELNGAEDIEECDEENFVFGREPGTADTPRRCTIYCKVHKPKKTRKVPGKKPAAKRAASSQEQ